MNIIIIVMTIGDARIGIDGDAKKKFDRQAYS